MEETLTLVKEAGTVGLPLIISAIAIGGALRVIPLVERLINEQRDVIREIKDVLSNMSKIPTIDDKIDEVNHNVKEIRIEIKAFKDFCERKICPK